MDKIVAIGIKPEDKTSGGVSVPEPQGWSWPKGVDPKEGDGFMCHIKQGDDGKLLITEIDGLPMGEDEPDDDDSDDAPTDAMDGFSKLKSAALGN